MKYILLLGTSFVFVVLRQFSTQRKKQAEMELQQFKAAAERAELREVALHDQRS